MFRVSASLVMHKNQGVERKLLIETSACRDTTPAHHSNIKQKNGSKMKAKVLSKSPCSLGYHHPHTPSAPGWRFSCRIHRKSVRVSWPLPTRAIHCSASMKSWGVRLGPYPGLSEHALRHKLASKPFVIDLF